MRLDEVEEKIAAAITALDATTYAQGTPEEPWTESDLPVAVLAQLQPESVSHLAFSVKIEQAADSELHRNSPGGTARVSSTVRIHWLYRLRPDQGVEDGRLHLRSAGDIVAAVNDEVNGWDGDGEGVAILLTPWQLVGTTVETDSPYQLGAVTFRIDHNLTV